MAEPKWFYGRGGQQTGPLSVAEMRDLVARGQITPTDMVWREGMPNWIPASQAADLMPSSQAAAPAPVGYYTSTLGMPQRAVENLKGHAQPIGDTSDWPLDEPHMQQFEEAIKLRKKISAAASLYRGLLLLSGISLGIFIPITIFSVGVLRGGQSMAMVPMAILSAVIGGFTVLYYFANRATRRSQAWRLSPCSSFTCLPFSFKSWERWRRRREPAHPAAPRTPRLNSSAASSASPSKSPSRSFPGAPSPPSGNTSRNPHGARN